MRRVGWLVLLALVPFLLATAHHWRSGFEIGSGDWAQYLLHAKALADGREYVDTGYLYSTLHPVTGPRAYPPGVALTAVPAIALFGSAMVPMRILSGLFGLVWLWIAGCYLARREGTALGAAAVLLCGLSPLVAHHASHLASDLPFMACVWGVIALADRNRGRFSGGAVAAISLLGVAAISFRAIGISLVPAMLVFAVLHRREQRWLPLVPAAVWTVSFWLMNRWLPVASSYGDQVGPVPSVLARNALGNLWEYRLEVAGASLYPFTNDLANDLYHAMALVLIAWGLLLWLPRAWRSFLAIFVAVYLGILLPFPWASTRFLWPVLPLICFGFVRGIAALLEMLSRWLPVRHPRRLATGLVVLVALSGLVIDLTTPPAPGLAERPEGAEVIGWVEGMPAGERTRVVFFTPRVMTYYTGVPAMPFLEAPPLMILDELCAKRITHVVLGDFSWGKKGHAEMMAVVVSNPERFPEAWSNGAFTAYAHVADCKD